MDLKAPVGLAVTTYEIQGKKYVPTLTHIFWGNDIEKATGVAHSHLITDFFFSSSFEGSMPWEDDILYLSNRGEILGKSKKENVKDILNKLYSDAVEINDRKLETGIVKQIQLLSQ